MHAGVVERQVDERRRIEQRRARLAVATREGALTGAEVRDHDARGDCRPRDTGGGDRTTGRAPAVRECVPDAEPGEHQRHVLATHRSEHREHRKRREPVLVEVPERVEQSGHREPTGVELVQREPGRRRVHEVRERKAHACALGGEVLSRQPVHGQRAECDCNRLRDEQQVGARPQPPQRREEHQHRVDVRAEPERLLAGEGRDAKRVAVCRRPDRLHHVAEVEPPRFEGAVAKHRQRAEARRERGDRDPNC